MTRPVMMTITRIEAVHLSQLTQQFLDLLDTTVDARSDAAVGRLVPDAYRDDEDAAAEFRRLTERDLLDRRTADAALVRQLLAPAVPALPLDTGDPTLVEEVVVHAAPDEVDALLRTLAAIRLVLASRLGVDDEDTHDSDDPRFAIYDWLGYRLDALLTALDEDPGGTTAQ